MICPKCQKEMIKGFIPTVRTALMFLPEGIDVPLTIFGKPKDAVLLTKTPYLSTQKAESYFCNVCEFIITPVSRILNVKSK